MTERQNSDQIAEGIKSGVRDSRLHLTDGRVLFLAAFIFLFCILSTVWQQHVYDHLRQGARKTYDNCVTINRTNQAVNAFLQTVAQNASSSPSLSAADRVARAQAYAKIHFAVVDCGQRP